MTLEDINKEYDKLQLIYGDKNLDSIYNGGCIKNPDVCFVFMNPTKRNIASRKDWHGLKSPWIGTKNVWNLFYELKIVNKNIYNKIRALKGNEWTEEFAEIVYKEVKSKKVYITNLAKCTQTDARPLKDEVFYKYLKLFEREIEFVNPKVIILFGNQVSSIFLNQKISVSNVRKELFYKTINNRKYKCYSVYYPVGNGFFNIDKAMEDIKWIIKNNK